RFLHRETETTMRHPLRHLTVLSALGTLLGLLGPFGSLARAADEPKQKRIVDRGNYEDPVPVPFYELRHRLVPTSQQDEVLRTLIKRCDNSRQFASFMCELRR